MIGFAKKDIVAGHLKLHTETFGDLSSPACLFISGAMAPARFWTDFFCEKLADNGYFVIRYDHRDIGESSFVDWQKEPYTLFDLAHDAIAILTSYGIKKAHFIGHSMGGYICQVVGVAYPDRILSLSIISSGSIGATDETDLPLTDNEKKILDKTWEIFLAPKKENNIEEHISSFLPIWKYLNGKIPFDEEMAKNYTKDLLTRTSHKIKAGNNHELLMKDLTATLEKRRGILKKITSPVLVIHGENDYLALPKDAYAIYHAILQAHLEIIPDMGHMIFNQNLELKIIALLINHFKKEKISFKKATQSDEKLLEKWFQESHVKEHWDNSPEMWENLLSYLKGKKVLYDYWIGLFENTPFCLFITSDASENEPNAPGSENYLLSYINSNDKNWTIDFMIGEEKFLNKGLSYLALQKFTDDHKEVTAFLIDPKSSNTKAINVYEKAGFSKIATFIPKKGYFAGIEHVLMKKLNSIATAKIWHP